MILKETRKQELVSPLMASKLFNVHYQTIRNWLKKGLIPVVIYPSGKKKFDLDVIKDFAKERGIELDLSVLPNQEKTK